MLCQYIYTDIVPFTMIVGYEAFVIVFITIDFRVAYRLAARSRLTTRVDKQCGCYGAVPNVSCEIPPWAHKAVQQAGSVP